MMELPLGGGSSMCAIHSRTTSNAMIRVNEVNEGFNKMKWSCSPSKQKNKWIRLTMKTRKKEKPGNAFVNEGWMKNDEQWKHSLLHDNNPVFWIVG